MLSENNYLELKFKIIDTNEEVDYSTHNTH